MLFEEVIDEMGVRLSLTPSERKILRYMLIGYDNESVAKEIYITVKTIKNHINNICHKSGMNRKQLQAMALFMCCDDQKDTVDHIWAEIEENRRRDLRVIS